MSLICVPWQPWHFPLSLLQPLPTSPYSAQQPISPLLCLERCRTFIHMAGQRAYFVTDKSFYFWKNYALWCDANITAVKPFAQHDHQIRAGSIIPYLRLNTFLYCTGHATRPTPLTMCLSHRPTTTLGQSSNSCSTRELTSGASAAVAGCPPPQAQIDCCSIDASRCNVPPADESVTNSKFIIITLVRRGFTYGDRQFLFVFFSLLHFLDRLFLQFLIAPGWISNAKRV